METEKSPEDIKADIIANKKAEFGFVFTVSPACDKSIYVVCKRMTRKLQRELKLAAQDDRYKDLIDEKICQACVVHPDIKGLESILDQFPMFEAPLARAIVEASGGGEAKKI